MKLEQKYVTVYKNWLNDKSRENTQALIDAVYPTIEKGLKTFGGGNPTLYGKAKLIALNAIENYDPAKAPLDSYLMLHLQRLQRLLPQSTSLIKIPEAVRLQAKELSNVVSELEAKYGRPPSDQEIADTMGISLKRLEKIRTAMGSVPESVFPTQTPTKQKEEVSDKKMELWMETVYKDLAPTQQYIMENYYGLHGKKKMTLEDIAGKLKIGVGTIHNQLKQINEKIGLINKL